ncbi:MAG: hypothetical protein AB7O66_20375 [Limisphaerales bacterium]
MRTISVRQGSGGRAGGAAFSSDGGKLYWSEGDAGAIGVFGTADGGRINDLKVHEGGGGSGLPAGPLGEIVVGADGKVLFASDPAHRRVLAIDAEGGRVLGILPTGSAAAPSRLVVAGERLLGMEPDSGRGRNGSVWMADIGAPERPVLRRRWTTRRLFETAAGAAVGGGEVGGDLAGDGGSMYVVDPGLDGVVRVDLATAKVGAWRLLRGRDSDGRLVGAAPRGLAYDGSAERLYVAESDWDAIAVLNPRTLSVVGHLATPGRPFRLRVAPGGDKVACLSLEGLRTRGTPEDGAYSGNGDGEAPAARSMLTLLDAPSTAVLETGTSPALARAGVGELDSPGAMVNLPGGGNGTGGGGGPVEPNPSNRPLPALLMPIEVLGLGGSRQEVGLTLTAMEALRAAKICLTLHGVQYEDKVRMTINGAHSVSINHRTAEVMGNARLFGGFGSGFHTIPVEVDLPKRVLREGENRIEFEYTRQDSYAVSGFKAWENRIDDASSGYRVIRMNLKDRGGRLLLDPERFQDDDPVFWEPPLTDVDPAQAIQDGWNLWRGLKPDGTPFRLKNASSIGLTRPEIKATCSDCHAQDGRDLKYFNYSNHAIVARSRIHGLTEDEGRRIAAYIRTLSGAPVVRAARPWNPPFQPGPGLDSLPEYEWAAGAGIDAVVEDPAETYNGIFPGAYRKDEKGKPTWDLSKITPDLIRPSGSLSMREIPIALQLLDWNHWLPKVHPIDGYEEAMETNAVFRAQIGGYLRSYSNAVARLRTPAGSTNFAAVVSFSNTGQAAMSLARVSIAFDSRNHTLKEAQRRYALMLLPLVKSWELYMEYNLGERVACETCGPRADKRSWRVGMIPFNASPNIAGLLDTREDGVTYVPRNGHGIGDNSAVTFNYVSSAWYHLQLILDHGNRNPLCGVSAGAPFDWPYVMAHLRDLQSDEWSGAGLSMMSLMYLYLAKAPQIYDTGLGVERSRDGGWQPYVLMPYYLQHHSFGTDRYQDIIWKNVSPQARGKMLDALYRIWLDKNLESSRDKYFVPLFANDSTSYLGYQEPGSRIGGGAFGTLADRVHFALSWKTGGFDGSLNGFGVSAELQDDLIDWANEIWPTNGDGTPAPWEDLRPKMSVRER